MRQFGYIYTCTLRYDEWLCFWQQVVSSAPVWNRHSDILGFRNKVHCKKMGCGLSFARGSSPGWNGPWRDVVLSGSWNYLQMADCECGCETATVNWVPEYTQQMGEYHTKQWFWEYQWGMTAVSIAETEFSAHYLLNIQTTLPPEHPTFTSALKPIMVVPSGGGAHPVQWNINEMMYGMNFNLVNVFDRDSVNLKYKDLNTSIMKSTK